MPQGLEPQTSSSEFSLVTITPLHLWKINSHTVLWNSQSLPKYCARISINSSASWSPNISDELVILSLWNEKEKKVIKYWKLYSLLSWSSQAQLWKTKQIKFQVLLLLLLLKSMNGTNGPTYSSTGSGTPYLTTANHVYQSHVTHQPVWEVKTGYPRISQVMKNFKGCHNMTAIRRRL